MALKILDHEFAFTPGADLWLVTDGSVSAWSRKIDWHLNFQIRRARLHEAPVFDPSLSTIIEECEVAAALVATPAGAPLMIASSKLVPNTMTVVIGADEDARAWAAGCHAVWVDLGRPLARIFLPDGLAPDVFGRAWPSVDGGTGGVEVVSAFAQ